MIDQERLLKEFLELVTIDSQSGNELRVAERLAAELEALGLEVYRDPVGEAADSNAFNIIARLPGTAEGAPVLFSAHMDTVSPGVGIRPVVQDGVIRSSGDTILGADDKAGVCGILEALRTVLERDIPHRETEIVFTVNEECLMLGAKALDYSRLKSRLAFVMDGPGDVGNLLISAPTLTKIFATVRGRSAHAGLAPETGVSAIRAAAKGIANMKLLRIDEETTCNIGTFHADFPTNIVPDRVELIAEARGGNAEKVAAQVEHMRNALQQACDETGAALEFRGTVSYREYALPADAEVNRMAIAALERLGCRVCAQRGNGGTDGNFFMEHGITPVMVGAGLGAPHTLTEYITLDNLYKASEFVLDIMTH